MPKDKLTRTSIPKSLLDAKNFAVAEFLLPDTDERAMAAPVSRMQGIPVPSSSIKPPNGLLGCCLADRPTLRSPIISKMFSTSSR